MNSLVTVLLSFLLLYKYWALFSIIFLAAVIVPFPSNTVLLAAGAFASQGYFSFSISLSVAVAANILGDCIDYAIAKKYGRRAIHILHLRMPTYLERLEEFIRRYPGSTIFVTRFVGTVEEVVSFLAGYGGIPFGTFLIYDVLGNTLSIIAVLYTGYFLGIHWQDFTSLFSIVGWIVLGATLIAAVALMLWYRNRREGTG